MLRRLTRHARLFSRENHGRRWISVQSGDELYLPGTTLDLQFQADGFNTFEPLAVTVLKRFEPFTSAAVLLSWLGYRSGKGGPVPWSPSLEGHLQHAIREIQESMAPNWFELIRDDENRPDTKIWKDWMWEVSTWRYKMPNHNKKLAAYRLLHRLQGRYIPRLFGVVRLRITPESTALHPITDIVQGLASISLASAWRNSSLVLTSPSKKQRGSPAKSWRRSALSRPRTASCTMTFTPGMSFCGTGAVLQSPLTLDRQTSGSLNSAMIDEEWSSVVGGSPDTRCIRNLLVNPEDGP
ncbi:hypothetical protein EV421DRAFT_2041464 [Armillaria borealis]|uniref:Uncharacterized protein n=1 Tax=Armillaria borealis TaxID=47425 RepID=A0AA39IWD5_9AGAR|nr:hypothetical protein EV421DRAFT_2041464 [Armillaria borealis]